MASMTAASAGAVVGLAVLAAVSLGCGTAQNYLDPAAPFYEGQRAAPVEPAFPPGDAPLRVVSFNIEFGHKIDEALRVFRENEPLRDADILALQEMDAPGTERLAGELGMNYIYFPGGVHPTSGRDFGCAILSPWPITEPRKLILPGHSRATGLRRAAVVGTIRRGTDAFRVYAVHLPAPQGISGASRRDQVQALIADAAGTRDPVVMVGDFNSHGIGEEFVAAGYRWPTRALKGTERMWFLSLSFDHIFTRGLDVATGEPAAGVIQENRGASDHRPVWVRLVPLEGGNP